jgi:hypothetical protein
MSEPMERAHETIHENSRHGDPWARGVAVLVALLAAVLAMAEIGSKSSQTAYLTHHVTLSNEWAFYQAKNLRSVVRTSESEILSSLPNAQDPTIQDRIKQAKEYSVRMHDDPEGGDGMKQLAESAQQEEAERDEALHRYHNYEYAVGALEIGIVLASVSILTRMRALTIAAAAVGGAAALASLGVATNLF